MFIVAEGSQRTKFVSRESCLVCQVRLIDQNPSTSIDSIRVMNALCDVCLRSFTRAHNGKVMSAIIWAAKRTRRFEIQRVRRVEFLRKRKAAERIRIFDEVAKAKVAK